MNEPELIAVQCAGSTQMLVIKRKSTRQVYLFKY